MAKQQVLSPTRVVPDVYSREAGPFITTVGTAIWKVISVSGNVDFVLSLQSEKLGVIMQAFQDWGWLVIFTVGFLWGFYEYKTSEKSEGLQERTLITPGALIATSGVAFLFGVLVVVASGSPIPSVVTSWGRAMTSDGPACQVVIDTTHLKRYQSKFYVVSVCGVTDPSTDMYTDSAITFSKPFTITGSAIQIDALLSKEMTRKLPPDSIAETPTPDLVPHDHNQHFSQDQKHTNLVVWYRAAIVPQDVDMSKVNTLMDLKHEGGKVFDPALWN